MSEARIAERWTLADRRGTIERGRGTCGQRCPGSGGMDGEDRAGGINLLHAAGSCAAEATDGLVSAPKQQPREGNPLRLYTDFQAGHQILQARGLLAGWMWRVLLSSWWVVAGARRRSDQHQLVSDATRRRSV